MAGVFGLGHGVAFSFVLAEMHLSTVQLASSLLAFNLGIELVQLLLVCLALPSLLVLARLRAQPALRVGGALITATAAMGWPADRLGLPNPVARVADSAGSHTTGMLTVLVVAAVVAGARTLVERQRGRSQPELESAATGTEPAPGPAALSTLP